MSTSASTTPPPQTQSNSHKMGDTDSSLQGGKGSSMMGGKDTSTPLSSTTPPPSSSVAVEDSLDTLRHKQTPASGHTHSRLTPHAFPLGNLPHSFASLTEARASVAHLIGSRHSDPISEEWTAALLNIHDLIGTTLSTVSPNLFLEGKSRTPQEVLDMVLLMKHGQGEQGGK